MLNSHLSEGFSPNPSTLYLARIIAWDSFLLLVWVILRATTDWEFIVDDYGIPFFIAITLFFASIFLYDRVRKEQKAFHASQAS